MINRRVEQLAARVAHNHEVAGSSPAPATRTTASARVKAGYAGEPDLFTPPLGAAGVDSLAAFFLPGSRALQ